MLDAWDFVTVHVQVGARTLDLAITGPVTLPLRHPLALFCSLNELSKPEQDHAINLRDWSIVISSVSSSVVAAISNLHLFNKV